MATFKRGFAPVFGALAEKKGRSTPWGPAQGKGVPHCRGVVAYSTAGHGGIHVSPTLNALIPEPFRAADGWYEEDECWAAPVWFFRNRIEGTAANSGSGPAWDRSRRITETARDVIERWAAQDNIDVDWSLDL